MDFHLQPLVTKLSSYIKDTTHFLNKLNTIGPLPDGVLLVTLDVSSLYTNITDKDGIQENALPSATHSLLIWWRYIDDIFLIWTHGEDQLNSFITYLNSLHPTIKFTSSFSYSEIPFLDVNVMLIDDRLETDLYVKPTDKHSLNHPFTHLIPNNQFRSVWVYDLEEFVPRTSSSTNVPTHSRHI